MMKKRANNFRDSASAHMIMSGKLSAGLLSRRLNIFEHPKSSQ